MKKWGEKRERETRPSVLPPSLTLLHGRLGLLRRRGRRGLHEHRDELVGRELRLPCRRLYG